MQSGFITGIVLVLIGIWLVYVSIVKFVSFIIYGCIALAIGIYMIVNSGKEDRIEQIRKK